MMLGKNKDILPNGGLDVDHLKHIQVDQENRGFVRKNIW